MRDNIRHFPVNWIDGMKISKNHFISQDDAWKDALNDVAALGLSPVRYGVLLPPASGEDSFNVKITLDNQNTLRVTVLSCNAVTSGGVRIILPSAPSRGLAVADGIPALSFQFSPSKEEAIWWIVLIVNPFDKLPAGSPDLADSPPRYPYVLPSYTIQVISDGQYQQFDQHPYALTVGKVSVSGSEVSADTDYIPPCFSISAHNDLVSLHGEIDGFLGLLERRCIQIVQKIYTKKQQNEISELVQFLCDRIVLYLGQAITDIRWMMIHESPASLFAIVASLARVMKNTIDLRIGSGKEEMMNYLSEWCELKQGELESMLSNIADLRYDNNDINQNVEKVVTFVKVTAKLFETLSKLEFIGERKKFGIFIKEETLKPEPQPMRRRFLG